MKKTIKVILGLFLGVGGAIFVASTCPQIKEASLIDTKMYYTFVSLLGVALVIFGFKALEFGLRRRV